MFFALGLLDLILQPLSLQLIGFDLAAGVLVTFGAIDDRRRLRWFVRMGAQVIAALILVHLGGVRVEDLSSVFGAEARLSPVWSDVLTVVSVVGIINAINMIDGVDGLAGSVCLAVVIMLTALATYAGNIALARDLLVVAGALTGFLLFNLRLPWSPRASIFLGNAGAELLGLIIAAACFRLTQNVHHPISPKVAPFLLAPALIDCLTLIVRRTRRGVSPFHADRDHLHHLLLDSGFSATGVVGAITFATLVVGGAALLAAKGHVTGPVFIGAFLAMWASFVVVTRSRERFRQAVGMGRSGGLAFQRLVYGLLPHG